MLVLYHAVRRPAFGRPAAVFSGASMSGPGSHPRSASLRSPPSASPKQRADKTARSLPGHLRIPSLASLAPGKPEKPPPHATIKWYPGSFTSKNSIFLNIIASNFSKQRAAVGGGGWVNRVIIVKTPNIRNIAVDEAFRAWPHQRLRRCRGNGRGRLWPRRLALAEAKMSEANFGRGCERGHDIEAPEKPSSPAEGRASHSRKQRTKQLTSHPRKQEKYFLIINISSAYS